MKAFLDQLMLRQFAVGGIETLFNGLLIRSPHLSPILRKMAGKILHIQLKNPDLAFFILFSENRTDWLSTYEGNADCSVSLEATTLPKLADKSQLSQLINQQKLVLNGDLQVLQQFSDLLDQLEKDPAEWLSHFIGDVPAQVSTDFAKGIFGKLKSQFEQNSRNLVDNLTTERPVFVHRLEVAHFCDQVEELAQQGGALEQKFAKLLKPSSTFKEKNENLRH
ncbi:MAG: SCP2 sterol-binding domain-containing protein [Pasteurellaceae bacterium]|nr:SCP2 sterol-binding domain-containing protein [Pasteurellaceae bacterium]